MTRPRPTTGAPRSTTARTALAALTSLALGLVACSGDDEASPSAGSAPATPSSAGSSPSGTDRSDPDDGAEGDDTSSTVPTMVADDPIPTVDEAEVPGLDSDDAFCRSWSEFAGSFQALAYASNVGTDPQVALRAEVIAAPTVVAAATAMGEHFPDEVADERELFLDGFIGPFTQRATRATSQLAAAGVSEEAAAQLRDAWLAALLDQGLGQVELVVVVPESSAAAVDDAVVAFVDTEVPMARDADLVTDANPSGVLTYIAASCPDQGILGGTDIVGD